MSLDLTAQEEEAIWAETERCCPPVTTIDRLETIRTVPAALGSGARREMELAAGLELCVFNETYREDICCRGVENDHLVQFKVLLSGVEDSGDHVLINGSQSYIGGSGRQLCLTVFSPQSQPKIGVDIHLQPQFARQLFATSTGELPAEWQPLLCENDWQKAFSPKTTEAMRSVVHQIIDCPLTGVLKQVYLQGKVFELIALQLASVQADRAAPSDTCLKPHTIARIQYAADILRSQIEHPPSQTELAQQVGVSDRTLRRGFQALFGTTVFGYLAELRLCQAEQLLRDRNLTVAEVAQRSGYNNQGHFAAAFKRKFGITPKQCAMGKRLERSVGEHN